jgi:hypothetical protein
MQITPSNATLVADSQTFNVASYYVNYSFYYVTTASSVSFTIIHSRTNSFRRHIGNFHVSTGGYPGTPTANVNPVGNITYTVSGSDGTDTAFTTTVINISGLSVNNGYKLELGLFLDNRGN